MKVQPIDNTEVDGAFYAGDHSGFVRVDGHPEWREHFANLYAPLPTRRRGLCERDVAGVD